MRQARRRITGTMLVMLAVLGATGCVTQREPQVLVEPTYSHVREERLTARAQAEPRTLEGRATAAVPEASQD